jgi:two-component system KDP operon response regulator KdpE
MTSTATILVVDDEAQMRRLLQLTLEPLGYRVRVAETAADGMRMAASERPDLVVLDLGLPDGDGTEVLQSIRGWSTVPVLILSVRNAEEEIIRCLDAGADDYLVKPFRTGELLARVRTALRHHLAADEKQVFVVDDLSIDFSARIVKKGKEPVKLTATEYSLLALFARNAGRVLTHRYLLEQVWGPTFAGESQDPRVYVRQLRKKIEDDPSSPKILLTESGIGYRLASGD